MFIAFDGNILNTDFIMEVIRSGEKEIAIRYNNGEISEFEYDTKSKREDQFDILSTKLMTADMLKLDINLDSSTKNRRKKSNGEHESIS